MIQETKTNLEKKSNALNLPEWDKYVETKEFDQIVNYINKEYDVFKVYYDSMYENVTRNFNESSQKNQFVVDALSVKGKKELDDVFYKSLLTYANKVMEFFIQSGLIEDKLK